MLIIKLDELEVYNFLVCKLSILLDWLYLHKKAFLH